MILFLNQILKMPGPISQNGNFYSNNASSPKISWFQISFKSVKPFGHKKRLRILQLPIPYCVSLIMVTITSHIFINIFQPVHFSAVKFTRGNEKNMNFVLIPKSLKVWKKSETVGLGSFKSDYLKWKIPLLVPKEVLDLPPPKSFFPVFFFLHKNCTINEVIKPCLSV